MARSLHWKAAVALNFFLLVVIVSAVAQSPSLKSSITYSCRALRLESVIEQLSKSTGYDFIYSRSQVDLSRVVSLNVKDKPINEVLSLIEKQTTVSFKLKDHHIIVKSAPRREEPAKEIAQQPVFKSDETLLITSLSRRLPSLPFESHTQQLQTALDRKIQEVQNLLGSNSLKNIPPYYINRINFNNRHRGWFIGGGTYISDHGSGIELQAGLPSIHAVFQPHVDFNAPNFFYGSYGVGNTFNLVGNFSFNTIYMFSSRTTTDVSELVSGPFIANNLTITTTENVRGHKLKMLVRYSFSKNLSVRVGPVLNYRIVRTDVSATSAQNAIETFSGYGEGHRTTQFHAARRSQYAESWVGWDASIQYRINFFDHK